MHRSPPPLATLTLLGLTGLALATGCSDDQPVASATTTATTTADGASSSFCDGAVAFDAVSQPGGPNDPTAPFIWGAGTGVPSDHVPVSGHLRRGQPRSRTWTRPSATRTS